MENCVLNLKLTKKVQFCFVKEMSISCEIQLQRVNAVYFSGDKIKGRIVLKTQKNILVNAVFLTIAGEAISKWSRGNNGASAGSFNKQKLLYQRKKVFDGTNFLAGEHVCDISISLPYDCPSTCKGLYGHISYEISVRVRLGQPWIPDKVFRKPLIVYQRLNLNDNPENMLPVTDENIKFFCKWPCRSDPVLSSLEIPFSGYIPGQILTFLINLDNQSQYDITGIETYLHKNFIFWAEKSTNRQSVTEILAKAVISKNTLRLSKRMYSASIVVPPNTQRTTSFKKCIVSLHYELQVKLKTGPLHNDIVMTVPIIIGTVPLERRHSDYTLVTMQSTASTDQSRNQCSNIQISNNVGNVTNITEDVDLPSYASCIENSSSQQPNDGSQHETNAQQRIFVNLPQLPVYDTCASRTQAENYDSHPDWD